MQNINITTENSEPQNKVAVDISQIPKKELIDMILNEAWLVSKERREKGEKGRKKFMSHAAPAKTNLIKAPREDVQKLYERIQIEGAFRVFNPDEAAEFDRKLSEATPEEREELLREFSGKGIQV